MCESLEACYFKLNKQKVRDLIDVLLPEEAKACSDSRFPLETTNQLVHKVAEENPAMFKQLVSIADFKLSQPELWVEMVSGGSWDGGEG